MTATAKRIEQEIRQLPLDDLLALHQNLVASIHEREDSGQLDPAFQSEILRRVQEIELNKAEGSDAFEALKDM
jgi:hypothetical protein